MRNAENDPGKHEALKKAVATQYGTGYSLHGAEADLLVTDEAGDLYLTQTKLTPALEPVRLERLPPWASRRWAACT